MHKNVCGRLVVSMLAVSGVAGCQTTSSNVGQGPRPQLTNQVSKFFEDYKAIPGSNKTFAVSANGQAAGASHCGPSGRYGDSSSSLDEGRCNTEFAALNYCRTKSGGSPCFVYAWGNDIVWGRSEKVAPQQAVATPPKEGAAPVAAGSQVRKFVAIWEGVPGPITGEIKVEASSKAAAVTLSGSNDLFCEGLATFGKNGNGNWVLKCKDELILSGTLRELGQNGAILGTGKDSKGRMISFSVTSI
jgi:hypothetical protein